MCAYVTVYQQCKWLVVSRPQPQGYWFLFGFFSLLTELKGRKRLRYSLIHQVFDALRPRNLQTVFCGTGYFAQETIAFKTVTYSFFVV